MRERPVAMAGIMGGEDSGITLATTEVFLEAAFFAPKAIAGRARRYGFVSDASHRFERGVDFAGTRRALERATRLVFDICGGQAGPVTRRARPPCRRGSRCACARRASPRCSGCR
jgi:phenylalanyl-tRNA synthetase beta chain